MRYSPAVSRESLLSAGFGPLLRLSVLAHLAFMLTKRLHVSGSLYFRKFTSMLLLLAAQNIPPHVCPYYGKFWIPLRLTPSLGGRPGAVDPLGGRGSNGNQIGECP